MIFFSADPKPVETAKGDATNTPDLTCKINRNGIVKELEIEDGNVTVRTKCPGETILEVTDIDGGSVEIKRLKNVFCQW